MAQFEVIALDTTTPQLRAPGSGDSYLMPRSLAISTGVVTTSSPVLDLSQSWNASGITFTGIKFNVTDTASAAGSLLMDLQVGGVSKFKVDKAGVVTLAAPDSGKISFGSGTTSSIYTAFTGYQLILSAPSATLSLNATYGVQLSAGLWLNWSDVGIQRDLANTLAQRNGANGQTFRLYGNYSTASDFRRLKMAMSLAGVAEIKPEDGGTYAGSTVLYISGLPTSNPGPGILWNNLGIVNVGT